jgi:hypothetical protein
MYTIKVGEREIPLRYTMLELADMDEEIGTMDNFRDLILKGKRRIRNMVAAIRIMGNSGLSHVGQPADLTDEWLLDHLDPAQFKAYQIAVLAAFTAGWKMETEEERVHDVTLEEIERKKEQGS